MKKYSKRQPPVSLTCPECGCTFERLAYYVRVKHKRNPSGNIYCSPKCARLARWGRIRSKKICCSYCGKSIIRQENQLRNRGKGTNKLGNFCSPKCFDRWRSENLTGEDSPAWKGGIGYERGSKFWQAQRRKAREQDRFTCQDCGTVEDDRAHDVHHVVPVDQFELMEDAHALSNLRTLCRKCHSPYHEPTEAQLIALELGRNKRLAELEKAWQ